VIQLKKQKINAMLKSNGQFWSNVIASTRSLASPPQTPPPTAICSSSSSEDDDDVVDIEDDDEEEGEEEEEEEEENSPLPSVTATTQKKKIVKSTNGRKRRGNLPKSVTAILKQWLIDHCKHPYPTEEEKRCLRLKTNLTLNQISNWFINARRRILPFILKEGEELVVTAEEAAVAKKSSSPVAPVSKKRKNSAAVEEGKINRINA
jgi:hypothetical protein